MFKRHWKTPFKDSQFNIRTDERAWDTNEGFDICISGKPTFDPKNKYDAEYLKAPTNNYEGIEVAHDYVDQPLNSAEMFDEIHALCEAEAEENRALTRDYSDYFDGVEQEYNQVNVVYWDRDLVGVEGDPRFRQVVAELESWVEDIIGYDQIQAKQVKMYKGTVKKW